MNCRFCNQELSFEFVDLVNAPPSNSYLTYEELNKPEVFFPLCLFVCPNCLLVQIDEYKKSTEIFDSSYAYFSSYSKSWLQHCENYVNQIIPRLNLTENSLALEIASNDGYLLQYFKTKNIPCLGVEPTANTAEIAKKKGIETIVDFFGVGLANKLAEKNCKADLIIGNNVFAHVPNIHDFVGGLKIALKPQGIITLEFPHVLQLITKVQFDTIYHEHFSYFSLFTIIKIFDEHDLRIIDVDELSTHGGSLRIYATHKNNIRGEISCNINRVLEQENQMKLHELSGYLGFQEKTNKIKDDLLKFLIEQKQNGKRVAAYGAAAKGNTMLNYGGIKNDLVDFVVDASPFKRGMFMPGSHIPIVNEELIKDKKPDFILILPWNIKNEIMEQLFYIRQWAGSL